MEKVRDPRLENYLQGMDDIQFQTAAEIATNISITDDVITSIKNIYKHKKYSVLNKKTLSQAADFTIISSYKMWLEAMKWSTLAGERLTTKERVLYISSVSLTALSYALFSYSAYTQDIDYATLWSVSYSWSWVAFSAVKAKQMIWYIREYADKKNNKKLQNIVAYFDTVFKNVSDHDMESIQKKIKE